MSERRIHWIDYTKGFTVLLVVLAHSMIPYSFFEFLSYGISVFPFISGYLQKSMELKTFLIKRWRYLFWYYYVGLINTVLWIILTPQSLRTSSSWEYLKNFLIVKTDIINSIPLNVVPLWFFVMLFFLELIYILVEKNLFLKWSVILLGFALRFFFPGSLPFKLDVAISGLITFEIGVQFRKTQEAQKLKTVLNNYHRLILISVSLVTWWAIYKYFGGLDWNADFFGKNPFFGLIAEFSCIVFMTNLSIIFSYAGFEKLFTFISKNIVGIIGYHILIGSILYFPFSLFGSNPIELVKTYWYVYYVLTLTMILLIFKFLPEKVINSLTGQFW